MKILTGDLKGRRILFKPVRDLRPTSDKVRKAIFDMLKERVAESTVLDLFSGTGALGLEALSAGAVKAVFVDEDRARCRALEENIQRLGLAERAFILPQTVTGAVSQLSRYADYFDIIFMDPPYRTTLALETLRMISDSKIWHEQTLVVAETARNEELPDEVGTFRIIKNKVYGDTRLLIYAPISK